MEKENIDGAMAIGLEEEIFADLSAELSLDPTFNETFLLSKVKNALREVKRAKKYPSYYTEEQIQSDMYDYFSNIRNIALYDYNQIGGEFQQSNSEPGNSRTYMERNKLFVGIIPLSRL